MLPLSIKPPSINLSILSFIHKISIKTNKEAKVPAGKEHPLLTYVEEKERN